MFSLCLFDVIHLKDLTFPKRKCLCFPCGFLTARKPTWWTHQVHVMRGDGCSALMNQVAAWLHLKSFKWRRRPPGTHTHYVLSQLR